MRKSANAILVAIAVFCLIPSLLPAGGGDLGYLSPEKINAELKKIAGDNSSIARINTLAKTPGGRDLLMLELGEKEVTAPAIMVVANMEGNYPIASEAALQLARNLTGEWKDELASRRWYIIALGNPDGYAGFFGKPLYNKFVNDRPVNEDNDEATDEDGPDDLNGDGYITLMRQAHPEGNWLKIEDNPVLMKRADKGKGEKGEYRLFPEGIDNDGDGEINEDGPGGCNPGYNFPHAFKPYIKTDGMWAASEAESRAVLEFAFAHQEIAMILTFGRSNSLKNVPESDKKAAGLKDRYQLPRWMAREVGVDPDEEFTMETLIEMGKEVTGMADLNEEMVLQFLGVGAAVNPDREDLSYWNEISKRYNDFIKEAGFETERLEPQPFPTGSVEEWGYFQYGVPTFALDFWTLPDPKKEEEKKEEGAMTPDEIEKMSNEEFIALGNDKIAAFLKASGAPSQYTAEMVVMGLQGGMMTTKKMAEMMRQMKKKEDSGGADATEEALFGHNPAAFVEWQPYDPPPLGKVEIGGMIPYSTLAPPMDSVREVIAKQLPFIRELSKMLPEIAIDKVEIKPRSSDVWQVDAWVVNHGFLPYPTHQGQRCQRPTPVVVELTGPGLTFLEGKPRNVLRLLDGSGGDQKVSWLIQAPQGKTINLKAHGFSTGVVEKSVSLKGGSR